MQGQQNAQRLSEARQEQLITEQRVRSQQYSARLLQQERVADERAAQLQRQHREAQYQLQRDYNERLRQQARSAEDWRSYDYNHDAYFYSAPTFRYSYSGRTYDTSEYGADLLRRSVNNGYQEGYLSGQADRHDRWRSGYRDSWGYQDANYGYDGMYIDQPQYNYYFRQGFERGYDDGYSATYRYGQSDNGTNQIMATLLSQILNLRSLQ